MEKLCLFPYMRDILGYNHIIFRDYMNTYPEKAKEYEKIKQELAKKYPHDRKSYTNGKSAFILKMLFYAKQFIDSQ